MKRTIAVAFSLCAVLVCAVYIPTSFAQGGSVVPITVAKAAPTPAPSSATLSATRLAKKTQVKKTQPTVASATTTSVQAESVPTGTAIPFNFTIESAFTPSGVDSVSAIVKCYQITSLSNSSIPSVALNSTPLAVFPGGVTSKSLTLTPGTTTQVNLTFPSSTAGMQVIIIITGTGEDELGDPFDFSGQTGAVVSP